MKRKKQNKKYDEQLSPEMVIKSEKVWESGDYGGKDLWKM